MIKISIHPTFFFIFLLALLHGFIEDVLLLFGIVLLHELGHAYMALLLGWRVKKIELLPFGGVAEMEEYGSRSLQEELWVISAGPFVNFLLILLSLACLSWQIGHKDFLLQFLEYNLLILLFNLLPIWPLDGGKLVQNVFTLFFPYKLAIAYSLFLSVCCLSIYVLLVGLVYPLYFSLWIIAIFLCVAQWLEFRQAPYQFLRFLMHKYKQIQEYGQNDVSAKSPQEDIVSIILFPSQSVIDALEKLFRHKFHYYCVVNGQGELILIISEKEMLEQYFKHHDTYRAVSEIFR